MSDRYKVIKEFECCGKQMMTVIIKGRAACVMLKTDYNKIIETERKYKKCNRCGVA